MITKIKKIRDLFSKLFSKIEEGNIAYYPGCLTRFVGKEIEENYINILEKLGLDFIVADEIKCCGSPILNAGYKKLFEEQIKKNIDYFLSRNVTTIITNCPACYHTLAHIYSEYEIWNKHNFKVYHITTIINEHLDKLKIKEKMKIKATYHDPCHLGRYSHIYDEPRRIIKECVLELREMYYNREHSFCCGAGAGLINNDKETANKIAVQRIKQALETNADCIITACPLCYYHLKENAKNKIKVYELSQILVKVIE